MLAVFFTLAMPVFMVAAQSSPYQTQITTTVTIGADGTVNASQPDMGISYQIVGQPGAPVTITTTVYTGNPQPELAPQMELS